MLKIIDHKLLAEVSVQAANSPRLRKNYNLHSDLSDPVQRFINAIEPGTYVRPHRHNSPNPRWEFLIVLNGSVAVLLFDDDATVTDRVELNSEGTNTAVEIPAGHWHTIVSLEAGISGISCFSIFGLSVRNVALSLAWQARIAYSFRLDGLGYRLIMVSKALFIFGHETGVP